MSQPVFSNRPNPRRELADGRTIWESRSAAAVAAVVATVDGTDYVALVERGPALPDEVGKLCLPCGYLDWDETAFEAARREAYEETGLDLSSSTWRGSEQPWQVDSTPSGKQNITLHFVFRCTLAELPKLSMQHAEPGEVSSVKWLAMDEATELDLAFGHHDVLRRLRSQNL